MTPEELDELERLCAAATPGTWSHGFVEDTSICVGVRGPVVLRTDRNNVPCRQDREAIISLHNAAPALIAAVRDLYALHLGAGHPMWLPSVADALEMGEPFEASADDVLDRVRAVMAEVWRLRAFVPRWKTAPRSTELRLMVGSGEVARIVPFGSGRWYDTKAVATDYPTADDAARAVCARLGIPYVPVEVDDG